MKDIAKELGLSVVTVSKALRGHTDISEATRQRVLTRAKELHYSPNFTAQALITGHSCIVGLIVPDLVHPFFAQVARALSATLRKKGYCLLIASSDEDPALEVQQLEQLRGHCVDAIVVASSQTTPECFRKFEEEGVPYVLIDRIFAGLGAHSVAVDDETVGRLATEHLLAAGCKQLAHIRGMETSTALGRLNGFRQTLQKRGIQPLPKYIISQDGSEPKNSRVSGITATKRLLRMRPRPDGIFCYNDALAMGAIDTILDAGLKVPQDIAVIGCGNVYYDGSLRVALSSIDQHSELIGEQAAILALSLIENKTFFPPKTVLLEPGLVVRASTKRRTSR
jgi:LacI family transcriptional regulator